MDQQSLHDQYIQLLKNHDWYYQYSDDHRAYTAGRESWGRIVHLQKQIDPDYTIFKQYDPRAKQ